MKGAFWALCSVLLVSAAQLLLRSAMQALPSVNDIPVFISALWHFSSGTGALLLGLIGYVASMGCWYLALHRMALSKAYALLSLSYILVWGAAILLPGWGERFSWHGLVGVGFIILGVLVIFLPRTSQSE
ncbi:MULTISPECIES: 4-amino-4-deoxy-L-arabinose-phosphoundecaprenol flippase subunit ArnF [Enterobacter cloacae complex]|uniref:Probable 4-amino-4-deoxy-L-arabinose-phosphoundecaprenol flippase subunit ArnF n=1 Tax=Enterobacter genomosp. O TaxID=2364150 RepID=A0A0X4EP21_9ENTR|nr:MULTISPECIES: 4-amino-4-deoxy-L-arabinose-phosphoundecaprenol flippase subunit ArnF [Enterobacter cloacae complex]MCW1829063.1 4-amino-4-deoxy-L-arabinose-phosphoundecaprenol flippase subunit ArnF [Enterobacter asburiae]KUQ83449.1 4-amino-4-deoxy-L-arabinose-phospho-UDP flippase [Enterobacter genomosp. O]KZQ36055.1 4-amino-4-deoxy-L-arabinose-phospho-UDP flippase [Enterobacter genomosp. O]MCM7111113.1 4-amino-4-deoxy-L-arabinose-phosphoundecaprenol flippase subunit ArnF [Enterobacter cloacae